MNGGEALATAKVRLSIAAVKARNRGDERGAISVSADDMVLLIAAHSDLDRQLSNASGGAAIPAGYALVPIEPTEAMIEACGKADAETWGPVGGMYRAMWSAMLAAAPKPEAPAIPAGMKPWGPDSPEYPDAPADWDGGELLHDLVGIRGSTPPLEWRHGVVGFYNIVAYTPKAASASVDVVDAEDAIRIATWNACRSRGMSDEASMAVVNATITELAALRSQPAGEG